jgi:hypothetical protein
MIVRSEQMLEFEKAAVRNFENRMIEHVKTFSPPHARVLNREQLREVVQLALRRAPEHGFETDANIQRYLDLMLQLGSHFDSDPQLEWAARVLGDDALPEASLKLSRLDYEATKYLKAVAGPRNEFREQALRRAREHPPLYGSSGQSPQFEAHAENWLRSTYPEKYERLGREGARPLIRAGKAAASQFSMLSDSAAGLLIGLMFLLGSGVFQDPQTPWAASVSRESSVPEADRVKRLYASAQENLNRWLT